MATLTTNQQAGWENGQFLVSDPDGSNGQSAVSLNYLNYSIILGHVPYLYGSVTGVRMTNTGQTTLYSIPNTPNTTGKKFVVTNVLVIPSDVSGFLTPAIIGIGKSAGYSEYLNGVTLTGLDDIRKYKFLQDYNYGATVSYFFAPGDDIKIDVTTAATGTTVEYNFYLFGIFI